jgi:hypothetical protein
MKTYTLLSSFSLLFVSVDGGGVVPYLFALNIIAVLNPFCFFSMSLEDILVASNLNSFEALPYLICMQRLLLHLSPSLVLRFFFEFLRGSRHSHALSLCAQVAPFVSIISANHYPCFTLLFH